MTHFRISRELQPTEMSCGNNPALALGLVPHLRDGFIVAKVGLARKRDRFPHKLNNRDVILSFPPCPVILSEAQRSRRTPSVPPPIPSGTFSHNRAFASRYPTASALGLRSAPHAEGFSPWGMPSPMEAITA